MTDLHARAVTQADREAAARAESDITGLSYMLYFEDGDNDKTVQAFARHRQTSTAALEAEIGRLREALRRARKYVEMRSWDAFDNREDQLLVMIDAALAEQLALDGKSRSDLQQQVAEIIDPHSFCDVPFTEDPVLLGIVEQSRGDALRKADHILLRLALAHQETTDGK